MSALPHCLEGLGRREKIKRGGSEANAVLGYGKGQGSAPRPTSSAAAAALLPLQLAGACGLEGRRGAHAR